ncbi:MAG: MarR family transcriptional regulator [Steroidobacteraceae bacterium]
MPKQHYQQKTFQLQDSIGYLIKRAFGAMSDCIHGKFASQGCSFQQWIVLMHLRDGLALTVADLSRELRHDSGAMTRLIDQLEERGWIARQRNLEDRRVIELSLTAEGKAIAESLIPLTVNTLNTTLDEFSREEVQQLQSLLRRLTTRLRALESDPAAVKSP